MGGGRASRARRRSRLVLALTSRLLIFALTFLLSVQSYILSERCSLGRYPSSQT